MAVKLPLGRYAKGQMEALKMAEALQSLAIASIREDFSAEDQQELSFERMAWEDYVKELQSAVKNGTTEEFEDRLRRLIVPLLSQVMTQAAEAEAQQGAQ